MITISAKSHQKGTVLLLLTTVVWGTSFPLLKDTISSLSPSVLVAVRFFIAAIALLPWLRSINPRLLRDGVLLGTVYFLETMSALTGLESISANRSAFIIGLNVILVPLLGVLVGKRLPRQVLLATGLAMVGMSLMSWEGGGVGLGELLTLAAAIGVAVYILLLEAIAPRHAPLPLAAVQIWTMFLGGLLWASPEFLSQGGAIADHLVTLTYLGIIVTIGPLWSQALGQRWVPAQEAALLYTLEPVFAAFFSFWFLGEGLSLQAALGGMVILVATWLSQLRR
ncbi:MAG: DMT family transporter [Synechococcales bacterium]|nr:DMT family transporter [Synechococcales bacterium]